MKKYLPFAAFILLVIAAASTMALGGSPRADAATCPSIVIGSRSTGIVYLDYGWSKHAVPNAGTFDALGLRWECVRWDDLRMLYPTGSPIPSLGVGSLIRNPSSGRVYVLNRGLHWIPSSDAFSALNFSWASVADFDVRTFDAFSFGQDVPNIRNNGFAYDPSTGRIYVVYFGLHQVPDPTTFNAECFNWNAATSVRWDPLVIAAVPQGPAQPHLESGYLVRNQDNGYTYIVDCGLRWIPDGDTFNAFGWQWNYDCSRTDANCVRNHPWWMVDSMGKGKDLVPTKKASHQFDYGWCTWYVAQRRHVPWSGDASKWWDNAYQAGFSRGAVPLPGAVAVFIDPGDGIHHYGIPGNPGHVAYVLWSDPGTGRFRVAEKFGPGFDASTRDLQIGTSGAAGLVGFIYWQYRK